MYYVCHSKVQYYVLLLISGLIFISCLTAPIPHTYVSTSQDFEYNDTEHRKCTISCDFSIETKESISCKVFLEGDFQISLNNKQIIDSFYTNMYTKDIVNISDEKLNSMIKARMNQYEVELEIYHEKKK